MGEIIPHWLDKQVHLAPNGIAIERKNKKDITFSELKQQSQSFAKKLSGIGVKQGDHIAIHSENSVDMITAIHALSYLGAVAVMLNIRLTNKELNYQLHDADVSLVLASRQQDLNAPVYTFSAVKELAEHACELQKVIDLDDVSTIIYTSGTTGFPKGVQHTYGNHWWSAIASMLNLGLDKNDKWLAALPVFHVGGLSIFIRSVIYGIPVYMMQKFDKQEVYEAILSKGVTIASVVTVMLQQLVDDADENGYPETFRCMLLGGGPAPESLLQKAKARNIPVFQSYGMTETASQIVTLSPKDALEKLGSAGKALFPAQLTVDAPINCIGEIFVKGPMVTSGYYNKADATDKAITNGWLATGDMGYLDKEGFLYVVDRRKDLIISGGENIYPTEIENVLTAMEGIREAGVAGVQDEKWGQVPAAFIVKEDQSLTAEAIQAYASSYLAKYKLPKEIYFVDQLPRNASNKLVRNELLEL